MAGRDTKRGVFLTLETAESGKGERKKRDFLSLAVLPYPPLLTACLSFETPTLYNSVRFC